MTPETLKLEREAKSVLHINGLPIVSSASAEISNDSIGEKGNLSEIHLNNWAAGTSYTYGFFYYRDKNHHIGQGNNPI